MQMENDNIILFPKWKKTLEEESLSALKEKRYETALSKLNKLLAYQIDDYEIVTGKLICLMELGRFNEAERLCEELMQYPGKSYYNYVHIYLTILFQTHQYDLLMDKIEYELQNHDIPKLYRDQFKQLYEISERMRIDVAVDSGDKLLSQLFEVMEKNDYPEQWRVVENLRKLKAQPTNKIEALLTDENVHPITKTAIFIWLKDMNWDKRVDIHKFGISQQINPSNVEDLESSEMIIETLRYITDLEQQNPSLYQLLKKVLSRYTYVMYPILPSDNQYVHIGKALEVIGSEYLNIQLLDQVHDKEVTFYIEQIKMCESLYLSIIEE
ncbi:DUF3196 family protein [Oceanobacillus bengalensis]|uniref:Tetratricopeptide repeat protein n=1 Tax=Oceanobacillus bengalensis TaxID=1435466 RepID=A0A494Z5Y7_9BACI|nr:DUF3196 family protein [Oceanobacillus bengalensis]RKQ17961.1 tetratricopeptide repeat protein [Oceanobacillus bengalensis]